MAEAASLVVADEGPEDVDAAAGEGDDGLVVVFAFGPFSVVEGAGMGQNLSAV